MIAQTPRRKVVPSKKTTGQRKRVNQRRNRSNPTSQRVAAATNVGAVFKTPSNRISSLPNGVICVHNKEIVLTVNGTAAAGVIPATILSSVDVGIDAASFPWLGKFAALYDKFCFKSLKITFVPTLPTTTSGSIAIYFDSDDTSAAATFVSAATNEAALVCPIFEQSSISVPKHMLNNLPWFTVSGTGTGSKLQGAITGAKTEVTLLNSAAAGSVDIGYIMVEYIVHLKNASS